VFVCAEERIVGGEHRINDMLSHVGIVPSLHSRDSGEPDKGALELIAQ
jgi:hypothetical protein